MARTQVPRRRLGSTGVEVSAIGLGGFHLSKPSEDEAIRIVHAALDAGIDFLDNSWDYDEGSREERMGKALAGGRRDTAFLMTKVDGRTKDSARAAARRVAAAPAHRSRRPVAVPRGHPVRGRRAALRAEGGIEAAIEARDAGKVRFIGFTGHKDPAIHLHMLEVARPARLRVRHGADAAQRDGRRLRAQLPALRAARARGRAASACSA